MSDADNRAREPLRVAIGSLGAVGRDVASRIDAGIDGLRLVAVSARDVERATERVGQLSAPVPVLPLNALAEAADVVVECAPAAVFRELVEPAVELGRTIICISAGGLLEHFDLVDRARESGAQILLPTGAIAGLDTVRAASNGTIYSSKIVTRKPPRGLAGAPGIPAGVDLATLTEPLRIFNGTAREGARLFPANVNVAAALGLAGSGPDHTILEIWADPAVNRNLHRIELRADAVDIDVEIRNVPSEANPRTGKVVSMSVIASLRRLVDPLVVGT